MIDIVVNVVNALAQTFTSSRRLTKQKLVGRDDGVSSEDSVARLLGWLVSASLTTSTIQKDDPESMAWQEYVAEVQAAARAGDYNTVADGCAAWGGDYLRLITALDEGDVLSAVRCEPLHSRQFRVGERFAISLLDAELNGPPASGASVEEDGHDFSPDARAALRTLFEATPPELADTQEQLAALLTGFISELDLDDFQKLQPEECEQVGQNAARDALASLRWSKVVGDRIDTTQATRLLGVSRQALAQRINAGSILGIPGRRTTYFPTWQFDLSDGTIRPEVTLIANEFRSRMGSSFDPLAVASWMASPQPELDGVVPIEWLASRRDSSRLVSAARHSAARAAQ